MAFALLFLLNIHLLHILHNRGGEPISLEVEFASIYSDISNLITLSSAPNNTSASAFEVSVLPTPVGPKNKNEPIGRLGSFIPNSSPSYTFGNSLYRFVLSNYPFMKFNL